MKLAAAIGWDESFETPAETLTEQAESCNERKLQAKLAGEDGSDVYLWCMIKRITKDSEFIMDGVVTGLVEYGLEILLHETGFTLRYVIFYIKKINLLLESIMARCSQQNTVFSKRMATKLLL